MKKVIIVLLTAIVLININLIGNTNPVVPEMEANKLMELSMTVEISGAIQLYSVLKEEIELIDTEAIENSGKGNNWELAYNRDYYIGYNNTKEEAITPTNFKKVAKKYFAQVPALAASIGKRGFRYKNLPTIIIYYNNQITQGKALSKEDKLSVKQIEE